MGRANAHDRRQKRDQKKAKIATKANKAEAKAKTHAEREEARKGEEDLDSLLAQFQKASSTKVKLTTSAPPTPRSSFTFVGHPLKDELLLYGGEFFNGEYMTVYGDFMLYNISKKEWKCYRPELEDSSGPPPRSGHSCVVRPKNGGEMYIFGGEFSCKSSSQFRHYNDFWVFYFQENRWQKIEAKGGPSARSGHRMCVTSKGLVVFGGFFDNCKGLPRYYNDIHLFDFDEQTWSKINIKSIILSPLPRSAFQMVTLNDKVYVFGGFSRVRAKGEIDKAVVHNDAWVLENEGGDGSGWTWKRLRPQTFPQMLAGISIVQRSDANNSKMAFTFGGVYDTQIEESIQGSFTNDFKSVNLETLVWRNASVKTGLQMKEYQLQQEETLQTKEKERTRKKRLQKKKTKLLKNKPSNADAMDVDHDDGGDDLVKNDKMSQEMEAGDESDEEGGVGKKKKRNKNQDVNLLMLKKQQELGVWPSPRMSCGFAIKGKVLYMYGGTYEIGDRQITCGDMYSLDVNKLDKWNTLKEDTSAFDQDWFGSDDSESDSENDDDEDD